MWQNLTPNYAKQFFSAAIRQNQLCLIASPDGLAGSLDLNQDIFIYTTLLRKNFSVHYIQMPKRMTYIHVAKGKVAVNINDYFFNAGDGAILHHEKEVTLNTDTSAEVLLFELPHH